MKKYILLATAIVLFVVSNLFIVNTLSAAEYVVPRAVPADINLGNFGILPKHVMGAPELARLGLHPIFIKAPLRVLNFTHGVNGFVYDELMTGELVAVTESGELVYKISCANRISEMKTCPVCPVQVPCPVASPISVPKVPLLPLETKKLVSMSDTSWYLPDWFKGLLWVLFALALIALFILAIVALIRSLLRQENRNHSSPYSVQTSIPVTPPTISPFHPVLGQGRWGLEKEVWWGPFQQLSVSDRQLDGYHVTVDGRKVGVYLAPVRVENAGQHGSWLVTTQQGSSRGSSGRRTYATRSV